MKYRSYSNEKNKLRKVWDESRALERLEKDLKKIVIDIKSEHFTKKINKVPLLPHYSLAGFAPGQFEFTLSNFPDWAVPMSRVIPVYSTETGVNIDGSDPVLSFNFQFNYWFKRVSENNYILKVNVTGIFQDFNLNNFPLFVDLNLYILNEYVYNTSQVGVS